MKKLFIISISLILIQGCTKEIKVQTVSPNLENKDIIIFMDEIAQSCKKYSKGDKDIFLKCFKEQTDLLIQVVEQENKTIEI